MISIEPATRESLTDYYGRAPSARVRAVVARHEGKVVGVGGIAYRQGHVEVFSDLDPVMKEHKKTLYRTALAVVQMAKDSGYPAVASQDQDIAGSGRFLSRLGFKQQGEVWVI